MKKLALFSHNMFDITPLCITSVTTEESKHFPITFANSSSLFVCESVEDINDKFDLNDYTFVNYWTNEIFAPRFK